jgi:hypothetical protein
MDVNNLNTGEKIAGISGIALLIIMFLFSWFSFEGVGGGLSAWEAFAWIDFVLFLAAAAAIALAVLAATRTDVDLPIAGSAIVTGIGALGVLLVIFRIISPPDFGAFGFEAETDRSIGVFLGLLAIAGVTVGGWLAMQEEGASFTDVGGGGGPAPPPGGGGAAPPPQQQPPAAPPPPQQAPPAPPPPEQPPPQQPPPQ